MLHARLGRISALASLLVAGVLHAQDPPLPALPPAEPFTPIAFGDDAAAPFDDGGRGLGPDFFGDLPHDERITRPSDFLGHEVGNWLASPSEIAELMRRWDGESARVRVDEYGRTHEGRPLVYALISSERNMARIGDIQRANQKLAGGYLTDQREYEQLRDTTPAVAWMGYSIHGDETSGADAAVALAYHLIACTDANVEALLDEVVIVLDPCMNPDGRARFLAQLTAGASHVPNLNFASLHRGSWPYGRTNHYLFDMNRDWMVGAAPETRGRWRVLATWHPQLFVDGHEMSGLDTFLFYPQADPKLPALRPALFDWQKVFADACARAFDAFGWGYYTREWADAWYPGYSDAWGSLNGAIGMLYEQGRVGGQPLLRASGEVVSYREAVHGQLVASMSNLATLAENRREVLRSFIGARRQYAQGRGSDGEGLPVFVVRPGRHPDRERRFLDRLRAQGIQFFTPKTEGTVEDWVGALGERTSEARIAPGDWIVPLQQSQGALVRAYLDFDPRIDAETLRKERTSLEKDGVSNFYDITAWDLGRAFGLDAGWCRIGTQAEGLQLTGVAAIDVKGEIVGDIDPERTYAYAVDAAHDRSVRFAGAALEAGLAVHLADREFEAGGRTFPPGSLLLRRHENGADWHARVRAAAERAGVPVHALDTGRAPGDGPDLGGGHFWLLERPRIALLAGEPVSATGFGHVWQLVDEELSLPATILGAGELGGYDLRRYNVLVVPPGGVGGVLKDNADTLASWVRAGGTLIAMGSSAASIAGGALELGSTKRRRDVLDDLDSYQLAVERERGARSITIDEEALWGTEPPILPPAPGWAEEREGDKASSSSRAAEAAESVADEAATGVADAPAEGAGTGEGEDSGSDAGPEEDAEALDAWRRRFSPAGTILRAEVDRDSWITAGSPAEMPVFFQGSTVLLSDGAAVPLRLAAADRLRLGGLLWPEARERIADSAWLTVEGVGNGQLILFASPPTFRGLFQTGARLLANAIVYGPGAGASPPLGW